MKIWKVSILLFFILFSRFFPELSLKAQCSYTYSAQSSGTNSNLFAVKSVDKNIGWIGGDGAIIRRTIDGGLTWTNGNPNPGIINGIVVSIEAYDSLNAWCTTSRIPPLFIKPQMVDLIG